jgi:hypothetical protein
MSVTNDRPPDRGDAVPAAGAASAAPLDDLMLAMDVVDTLRHDIRIAERELGDDARRSTLKTRLREIYTSQGIDVPDAILEEGVRALEEDRFVYKGNRGGVQAALARVYVERARWFRRAAFLLAFLAAATAAWYVGIERPRLAKIEAERVAVADAQSRIDNLRTSIAVATQDPLILEQADRYIDEGLTAAKAGDAVAARSAADKLQSLLDGIRETTTVLPARLDRVRAAIGSETKDAAVLSEVDKQIAIARTALAKGDATTGRETVDALERLLAGLRQVYTLRIVQGGNRQSGVWRIPDLNPDARNYYLIVEAIGPDGKAMSLPITNEETKKTEVVSAWGVRVPERIFNQVRADKSDNGLVDDDIVGEKRRGETSPQWRIPVIGGAITEWSQ